MQGYKHMEKLANIVVRSKKNTFGEIYNVVNSCEGIDDALPTLYIGLNKAKECITNFNILKKYYPKQNCWWTFSKTERRDDYNNDVIEFQNKVIMDALRGVKYEYVNFITYPLKRIKKFISYINSNNRKLCFLTRESKFVFIYDKKLNTVFGLSLTLCEYCGIKNGRHKVVSRMKSNKNNEFIYDTSFLTPDMRKIIGPNTHYILPLYVYFAE